MCWKFLWFPRARAKPNLARVWGRVGEDKLGILADLARCLGAGDRVPHGLPWRLPQ